MDKVEGYIEHIIFRNEENGYTVLNLSMRDEEVTVLGTAPSVNEGEYMRAEGEYTVHPTYGRQFRASHCEVTVPSGGAALERYLGSGAIKGVGPALAARILKKFGDDTLRIMEEEPERLSEVKGISERKAQEIAGQVEEKTQMQNALIFLSQYGVSLSLGVKIYNQYQDRLYQVLRENPYKLAEDIRGVGFKIADEIAGKVGIRADSEFRIRSGLYFTLREASAQGHLYLPKEELLRRASDLLGTDAGQMEKYLTDLAIEKKLTLKTQGQDVLVYTYQNYFLELNTARMLQDLNLRTGEDSRRIEERIAGIEKQDKIRLDEMQKKAVAAAAQNGLLILTGGPGTGKTTTINTMIRYFEAENLSILLAAPTGRAAKRMTEATGCEASTIHRMLEVNGGMVEEDQEEPARFERNAENPLEADVIIIDEMSMVDIYLMHALLSAVVPGTRLILVGDRNQLPSVGPGSVLRDIIRSGAFPVITLQHIFRQAQESDIIVNAHRIHAGQSISLDNKSRDFFFLQRNDVLVIKRILLSLVSDKLPRYTGSEISDIQVLSPMRKGELGVEKLNAFLQKYLNPPAPGKTEKITGDTCFREGDKVMQIRNDYQLEWEIRGRYGIVAQRGTGVFNGDTGMIRTISPQLETLTVEFEDSKMVDYTFKQLDELELAYATTVHKAQGSEFPAVVIPLLGVPHMLMTRNLIYTAVTRARKCVVLVGSAEIFREMVANPTEENRYTTLAERIREIGSEQIRGEE